MKRRLSFKLDGLDMGFDLFKLIVAGKNPDARIFWKFIAIRL